MNISSKLLENAVLAFASLPGIGKKTALRLALHVLQRNPEEVEAFCDAVGGLRRHIQFCHRCHHLSDEMLCSICSNPHRDPATVCVVESIREVLAIENTQSYNGTYHVLGGLIAPIEGIGPEQLHIASLLERVEQGEVREIVLALSPTIEGDTTMFYLSKRLSGYPVRISAIARGVSFGGELEYADELTLGRSIAGRVPYKND